MVRLRFKSKIFLTLCFVALSVLGAATFVAVKDFEVDKIQQVFENNMRQNRSFTLHFQRELSNQQALYSKIILGLRPQGLSKFSKYLFSLDQHLTHLWVYGFSQKGKIVKLATEEKKPLEKAVENHVSTLVEKAMIHKLAFHPLGENTGQWLLALRVENAKSNNRSYIVVGLMSDQAFYEMLSSNDYSTTLLVDENGIPINVVQSEIKESDQFWRGLGQRLDQSYTETMSFEYSGFKRWFVSATKLGVGGLSVITITSKSVAFAPVQFIFAKMIVLCVALVALTMLFSLFLSGSLTSNLQKLMNATRDIRSGEFDIHVDIDSKDEMGELAFDFNEMAGEISRLMIETAEKGRMGAELKMAQTVQSNLFPSGDFEDKDIAISGFYQPASECGGDWWFYSREQNKTYLWIGDATGHGASAALVTSAAKSAAFIAQQYKDITIDHILFLMNNAIYETTHGQVQMTFMISCYDHTTGVLTYSRASHDPPYYLAARDKPVKKSNVLPLFQTKGKRLGEEPNSTYQVHQIHMHAGDRILFITDGITELKNQNDEMYGERRLLNTYMKTFNNNDTIQAVRSRLVEDLYIYRNEEPLHDDLTFFLFEVKSDAKRENQAA